MLRLQPMKRPQISWFFSSGLYWLNFSRPRYEASNGIAQAIAMVYLLLGIN